MLLVRKRVWVKVLSFVLTTTMILGASVDVWALRTNSTRRVEKQERGIQDKLWEYGFSDAEKKFVQTRVDEEIGASFARKAAINLIGHQAVLNLDEAADDYIKDSGEKGLSKDDIVKRLILLKDFQTRAVDNDDFLLELLDGVGKAIREGVEEGNITDKDLLAPGQFSIKLMRVSQVEGTKNALSKEEKLKMAKKIFIEDTRWPVLLLGRRASEVSLYSLGDPVSETHKAVIAQLVHGSMLAVKIYKVAQGRSMQQQRVLKSLLNVKQKA